MGPGPAGKSGTSGLINKGSTGKAINFGSKINNSHSPVGKTATTSSYIGKNNSTGGIGDNKISAANFGGKSSNTTSPIGKNSAGSFGSKTSSISNVSEKKNPTPSFGEIGGSSKSQKNSSGMFPSTTTEKNYTSSSYTNPKSKKSSMTFGIIWLPTRKRNKMKDSVYSANHDRRDRSKERTPSMYNYMAGDSSDTQTFKKKEEENDLLVRDRMPVAVAAVASDGLAPNIACTDNSDEKKELIIHENEESKEAAGDHEKDDKDDYLENKNPTSTTTDATWEKDKVGDKVDSVYLRPPPPNKARSTASTMEEEDCGIKCLYYTLQCCDCVLM